MHRQLWNTTSETRSRLGAVSPGWRFWTKCCEREEQHRHMCTVQHLKCAADLSKMTNVVNFFSLFIITLEVKLLISHSQNGFTVLVWPSFSLFPGGGPGHLLNLYQTSGIQVIHMIIRCKLPVLTIHTLNGYSQETPSHTGINTHEPKPLPAKSTWNPNHPVLLSLPAV